MKKNFISGLAFGAIIGACVALLSLAFILLALKERGYWAYGGEWILISICLPTLIYAVWVASEKSLKERQKRAREINEKRLLAWKVKDVEESYKTKSARSGKPHVRIDKDGLTIDGLTLEEILRREG